MNQGITRPKKRRKCDNKWNKLQMLGIAFHKVFHDDTSVFEYITSVRDHESIPGEVISISIFSCKECFRLVINNNVICYITHENMSHIQGPNSKTFILTQLLNPNSSLTKAISLVLYDTISWNNDNIFEKLILSQIMSNDEKTIDPRITRHFQSLLTISMPHEVVHMIFEYIPECLLDWLL
jgi:hypothetical protein